MKHDLIKVATHIPLLVRAFTLSEGDVLELGTGYFSTLVLRWLCEMSGRTLYSYESSHYWYTRALQKPKPFHKVIYVKNFDEADIERHWGLVFIDHGPNQRRITEIKRLANYADYMVIHDTNPVIGEESPRGYHYNEIWSLFKYRYDFTKYNPHTSCVSNLKDLSNM